MVNGGPARRIAARLLDSELELTPSSLLVTARRIAREEDPLDAASSATAAIDLITGLGPLEPLLADASVSDILVNGPSTIWVERDGRLELSGVSFPDGASIAAAAERAIAPLGLRLDQASPVVDARLPDGSRLHAALPPVAPDGPVMAIRRFTGAVGSLDDMVELGAVDKEDAALLRVAVRERRNVLVCGGTGTGKTTLLNLLSQEIPPAERVVTVEDAAELSLAGHVVRLEARPNNSEGVGAIGLDQLVRHALRLRPDRIIVGEVRGPEALDMISAMATGHSGSMSTVHARDAAEALWRLEILALSGPGAFDAEAIRALLRAAIDLVVVMARVHGQRRLLRVEEVGREGSER